MSKIDLTDKNIFNAFVASGYLNIILLWLCYFLNSEIKIVNSKCDRLEARLTDLMERQEKLIIYNKTILENISSTDAITYAVPYNNIATFIAIVGFSYYFYKKTKSIFLFSWLDLAYKLPGGVVLKSLLSNHQTIEFKDSFFSYKIISENNIITQLLMKSIDEKTYDNASIYISRKIAESLISQNDTTISDVEITDTLNYLISCM